MQTEGASGDFPTAGANNRYSLGLAPLPGSLTVSKGRREADSEGEGGRWVAGRWRWVVC